MTKPATNENTWNPNQRLWTSMYFYFGRQLDTDIYTAKNKPVLYFTLNRILFPNKERRIRMSIVTGSHLISKSLKMEGVENIFTLAGDHVLPAPSPVSAACGRGRARLRCGGATCRPSLSGSLDVRTRRRSRFRYGASGSS